MEAEPKTETETVPKETVLEIQIRLEAKNLRSSRKIFDRNF